MSGAVKRLPARSEVRVEDTWDLTSLFPNDDAWRAAFAKWEGQLDGFTKYQGRLGSSAEVLAECLQFDLDFDRLGDRLSTYAFLKMAEDVTQTTYQELTSRCRNLGSRASQLSSYIRPEILAIPELQIQAFLQHPALAPYKLILQRILRFKPHTLGPAEEKLLAMQSEMSGTANQVFRQLNDAELKFGVVTDEHGQQVELSHATFSALLHCPNREVRKAAFEQYYVSYDAHKQTLAATYTGSVQRDIYYARARNYKSSVESSLFADSVPPQVYDQLISSVHENLPALHKYYEVRRKAMKLDELRFYDIYVPILSDLEKKHTWDEAVNVVLASLSPLGTEYVAALEKGLRGRWCDRYENQGKQSGAFSSGSYDADPYIMMNYQEKVLDHVFTLTHEAGHSMHSYYSGKNQPYQYSHYTIFVAEVASTFNEQLLSHYLQSQKLDRRERAFLINRELDAIRGTLFRQTMFAEFEKIVHALGEQNQPLTLATYRTEYRKLLELYFGPQFKLDPQLELECLRIPHFYRAFYVYKYATGLSAAIALSQRVLNGGKPELDAYLNFLKGGCSKEPLDLLRGAGVDLESPEPVRTALQRFARLTDELDALLN